MAEAAVIEVRAIDFYFFCPPKNKDQRAQHKNRSRFLLVRVCMCVLFFFFFPDVLRLHHHLLLRLRLRHWLLLLRYSAAVLDLCVSAATTITTIHSVIHSVIHSLVCIPLRIWLSGNEQK